jgi:glutamine amidotransferase
MIAIVDYAAGNVRSVLNALHRLGAEAEVTANPEKLRRADRVIFPGVGHAETAMANLRSSGLDDVIHRLDQPFLGICLGMQLMCKFTEEGDTAGLGIFSEEVKRFRGKVRVPHMGWNEITRLKSPLYESIPEKSDVYFVHSYFVEAGPDAASITHYGVDFASALAKNNFFGVQYHPEKSGDVGEKILSNFLNIRL